MFSQPAPPSPILDDIQAYLRPSLSRCIYLVQFMSSLSRSLSLALLLLVFRREPCWSCAFQVSLAGHTGCRPGLLKQPASPVLNPGGIFSLFGALDGELGFFVQDEAGTL